MPLAPVNASTIPDPAETGKQVVALPIEATAIGNLKVQLTKKTEGL